MAYRETLVSAEESNRRRIGGLVEDSRTKPVAKRSDRVLRDFFNGLLASEPSRLRRVGATSPSLSNGSRE